MSTESGDNGDLFAYFGFGSLVNRRTLSRDIVDAIPVTLKGWRRHWQARPQESIKSAELKSIALLSIHRDPSCNIDGLLVVDRLANLPELEKREHAYHKIALSNTNFIHNGNWLSRYINVPVHVHISPVTEKSAHQLSILRSYLDVVMQGFYREFGERGLGRFLETTVGFDLPIHEDRERPVYPRHQPLTIRETATFARIFD